MDARVIVKSSFSKDATQEALRFVTLFFETQCVRAPCFATTRHHATHTLKDKNRNVVTETGVEPATSRFIVYHHSQLDVDNNTIPGPLFLENATESRTVSRSSRAQ